MEHIYIIILRISELRKIDSNYLLGLSHYFIVSFRSGIIEMTTARISFTTEVIPLSSLFVPALLK
jgi:hypothetical protein